MSVYTLNCEPLSLKIDAGYGGRIIAFTYKGKNVLVTSATNPDFYGSTFWTSPQTKWHWPPPAAIDTMAYEVLHSSDSLLRLRSQHDWITGITVEKEFRPSLTDTAFSITYRIINTSDKPLRVAPWEITRVLSQGIVFFPSQTPDFRSAKKVSDSFFRHLGAHFWLFLNNPPKRVSNKFFCDGDNGWIAYAHDSLLFVKKFPPLSKDFFAPGESEIEIYLHLRKKYMELEQQGIYKTILPGESSTWEVKWYLYPVYPNSPAKWINPHPFWPSSIKNHIK